MNKAIISGRLTRDPEIRYSQSSEPIAVVRFSVACNRRFKRENEPEADFINCVSFGKTGEIIANYCTKGKLVGIVGTIRTNTWTNDSGEKCYSTEVQVEEIDFLSGNSPTKENNTSNKTEYYNVEQEITDDNLPF